MDVLDYFTSYVIIGLQFEKKQSHRKLEKSDYTVVRDTSARKVDTFHMLKYAFFISSDITI